MIISKRRLTALFRLLAVALCGFLWKFQHKADDGISFLWRVLLDSRVFQHESFEVRVGIPRRKEVTDVHVVNLPSVPICAKNNLDPPRLSSTTCRDRTPRTSPSPNV